MPSSLLARRGRSLPQNGVFQALTLCGDTHLENCAGHCYYHFCFCGDIETDIAEGSLRPTSDGQNATLRAS
jgi:hypothetical protein